MPLGERNRSPRRLTRVQVVRSRQASTVRLINERLGGRETNRLLTSRKKTTTVGSKQSTAAIAAGVMWARSHMVRSYGGFELRARGLEEMWD